MNWESKILSMIFDSHDSPLTIEQPLWFLSRLKLSGTQVNEVEWETRNYPYKQREAVIREKKMVHP